MSTNRRRTTTLAFQLIVVTIFPSCDELQGGETTSSSSSDSGDEAATADSLPECVALQFDDAGTLTDELAGLRSECEDGNEAPLSGLLHRADAVACTAAGGECVSYADCAPDEACLCASGFASADGPRDLVLTTRCYRADCRTDADCGDQFCGAETPCGYVDQLRCHHVADVCTRDSDCPGTAGAEICVWGAEDGHWVCDAAVVCE